MGNAPSSVDRQRHIDAEERAQRIREELPEKLQVCSIAVMRVLRSICAVKTAPDPLHEQDAYVRIAAVASPLSAALVAHHSPACFRGTITVRFDMKAVPVAGGDGKTYSFDKFADKPLSIAAERTQAIDDTECTALARVLRNENSGVRVFTVVLEWYAAVPAGSTAGPDAYVSNLATTEIGSASGHATMMSASKQKAWYFEPNGGKIAPWTSDVRARLQTLVDTDVRSGGLREPGDDAHRDLRDATELCIRGPQHITQDSYCASWARLLLYLSTACPRSDPAKLVESLTQMQPQDLQRLMSVWICFQEEFAESTHLFKFHEAAEELRQTRRDLDDRRIKLLTALTSIDSAKSIKDPDHDRIWDQAKTAVTQLSDEMDRLDIIIHVHLDRIANEAAVGPMLQVIEHANSIAEVRRLARIEAAADEAAKALARYAK